MLPALTAPASVGALVALTDDILADDLDGARRDLSRKIDALTPEDDPALYLRHMIVLGAIVHRIIFAVWMVPKNSTRVI